MSYDALDCPGEVSNRLGIMEVRLCVDMERRMPLIYNFSALYIVCTLHLACTEQKRNEDSVLCAMFMYIEHGI